MKICFFFRLVMASGCIFFVLTGKAQPHIDSSSSYQQRLGKGLFASDELFDIRLKGNIREVLNDRIDSSKKHPLILFYRDKDSNEISLPVEVKTRGHFRKLKENCSYPPLLIRFPKNGPQKSSVFSEQNKLKLVMPCKDDEYIIREWLVYRIYNLITERSFRTRLVRVKLDDVKSKKEASPFYGILLEEEKQLTKRNKSVSVNRKLIPQQTLPNAFLTMTVFQYLIGNTDWSIEYMQNIKFLAADANGVPIAVPYDFDHAGLVNAPYAQPAEELRMSSIREWRYRGYCIQDMTVFDDVIAKFNQLKNDIYALYTGCPLLKAKYLNSTIKYFNDFYATINNPAALKKDFLYPCDKDGTGNVVIKGLKED